MTKTAQIKLMIHINFLEKIFNVAWVEINGTRIKSHFENKGGLENDCGPHY